MFDNYKAFVRKDIPFILVMPETFLWNGELRFATLYYEYEKMTLEQAFEYSSEDCKFWIYGLRPELVNYIEENTQNIIRCTGKQKYPDYRAYHQIYPVGIIIDVFEGQNAIKAEPGSENEFVFEMTLEQAFLFQNYYECGSWFLSCLSENVETYIRFNGRNDV